MALCVTTALAGAVSCLCVRGARGRFGGVRAGTWCCVSPSSPFPPRVSRVACGARLKMEDQQVHVCPAENQGSASARSPARKWRIRRCAFVRLKMEDPQVRVRPPENRGSAGARSPPENGGSVGARSPARECRSRRYTFARPKMEDPQVRVRPPEEEGSAGACLPA